LLDAVGAWAAGRSDVSAVVLVGSRARGQAKPDSDVDLVVLTSAPEPYLEDHSWIELFGEVDRSELEDWGRVQSVRVFYRDGLEVEFGIATPDWAEEPLDEGTRRVLDAGFVVVFDRGGNLTAWPLA
jgi:predicted nucleotidyltransferase